jgi:hypothetical protein
MPAADVAKKCGFPGISGPGDKAELYKFGTSRALLTKKWAVRRLPAAQAEARPP